MAQSEDSVTAGSAIVRAAALVAVPWANRGGLTRVIADRPQFRLSLATIADEGLFSILPVLVRHLAVVAGVVELSGPAPCCQVLDVSSPPLTFSGADSVHAQPLGGPVLALNLMVPQGSPALRLERCDGGPVDAIAVFACDAMTVAGNSLALHDTLFPAGPVCLSGRALIVR